MKLRQGEKILGTFYHHFLPFIYRIIGLSLASLPVFFLMYAFAKAVSLETAIIGYTVVFIVFALVSLYITLVYWLDKLVVTNQRVVFIDWKLLTAKTETESELVDIQDIRSHSRGILSFLPIFNYGIVEVETASYNETINFPEAPDPEGIKEFIHTIRVNGNHLHAHPTRHTDRSHAGIDSDIIVPDGERIPDSRPESPIR